MTATAIASGASGGVLIGFTNNTNSATILAYTGQTTSDVFIWGAQFEAGSFASSYIPTTSAAVVRSADVCSITGAAFTGFYNASEGTIAVKYDRPTSVVSCTALSIDDTTVNKRMINVFSSGVERFGVSDGANTSNLDRTAGGINVVIGHAARYKNLDFAFSANALAVTTSTTQTVPTVTQMTLGQRLGSNHVNGHIHSIQYFNTIKNNSELQALSTP